MKRLPRSRLLEMVEEATVDAYGESEQEIGFFSMLEEAVRCPFQALAVGEKVEVVSFAFGEGERGIVAVCRRRGRKYRVNVTELSWQGSPPDGAEWIEAYRFWLKGGR